MERCGDERVMIRWWKKWKKTRAQVEGIRGGKVEKEKEKDRNGYLWLDFHHQLA